MRNFIPLLTLLALMTGIYAAHALGLGEGNRFGRMGALSKGTAAVVATPCSGTGLVFTAACNSQYIGIL